MNELLQLVSLVTLLAITVFVVMLCKGKITFKTECKNYDEEDEADWWKPEGWRPESSDKEDPSK